MASSDENESSSKGPVKMKRRRLHGACDLCRQKKIRCDSSKRPGNKCSNCVAFEAECTHVHVNQKIGQGYRTSRNGLSLSSESLPLSELRKSMDPLLKTILSPTYQAPTNPAIIRETLINLARYARALECAVSPDALAEPTTVPPVPIAPPSPPTTSVSEAASPEPSHEDSQQPALAGQAVNAACPFGQPPDSESCNELNTLADKLKRSMALTAPEGRFFGASSSVSYLDTAILMGGTQGGPPFRGAQPPLSVRQYMRPEFWNLQPWEHPAPTVEKMHEYPEPDLLDDLVEIYFERVNDYLPLLHRPTFERSLKANLHISDPHGFGGTVLGVCAVASRYSSDERVILDGTNTMHSSGYQWYSQMKLIPEKCTHAVSLYQLQMLCLAVQYLQGSSTHEMCWFLIGFAIRAALDIGLNRKLNKTGVHTVEDELRKRIFWNLVHAEAVVSLTVGRPSSITHSDIDVDYPVECDDEYWEAENPEERFKQPQGKPSKVSFFLALLKLVKIERAAQRAFYSVKHPEVPAGMKEDEWDRMMLSHFDSALNRWVDSVPDHLRWDPTREKNIFFDQSAVLHAAFYYFQIVVHKPFIASKTQRGLAFSSLAICTNAARAASRIMDAHAQRGFLPLPQSQVGLFVAGLVLLMSIWKGRRTGFAMMDERKEISAVQKIINVLKGLEVRWHLAGRFCDLLMAISSAGGLKHYDMNGELPPPEAPLFAKPTKRTRQTLIEESEQRRRERESASPPTSTREADFASSPSSSSTRGSFFSSSSSTRELDLTSSSSSSPRASTSPDMQMYKLPTSTKTFNLRRAAHATNSGVNQPMSTLPVQPSKYYGSALSVTHPMHPPIPPPAPLAAQPHVMQHNENQDRASQMAFTYPLYSTDLSRPFFQFGAEDPTPMDAVPSGPGFNQQLSELEALLALTTSHSGDGSGAPMNVTMADPMSNEALQQMFFNSQAGAGEVSKPSSTFPSGYASQDQTSSGGNGTSGMNGGSTYGDLLGNTGGTQHSSGLDDLFMSGGPSVPPFMFNDPEGEAMMASLPAGYDWNDWSSYISNVESIAPPALAPRTESQGQTQAPGQQQAQQTGQMQVQSTGTGPSGRPHGSHTHNGITFYW